jgi:hypothetical protein
MPGPKGFSLRFRGVRHSHATISLAAGNDLKSISMALGHFEHLGHGERLPERKSPVDTRVFNF